MATCSIDKVWAPNGKESILYKEALKLTKDPNQAVELWAMTRSSEFKTLFGDWQSEDFKGELDENGEPSIKDIVKPEYKLDSEAYNSVQSSVSKLVDKVEKLKEYNSKMRDVLTRKIEELERRVNAGDKTKNFVRKLKKLKDNLRKLDWRESALEFAVTAKTNVNYAASRMNEELRKKDPNLSVLAKYKSYLDAFDLLNDIRAEILSNDLMSESMEDVLSDLKDIIDDKDSAKRKYKDFLEVAVSEKLASISDKYSAKELRDFLNRAPFDITSRERWLRYAGDSRDTVIAHVAKLINEQQQKTREASIEFTHELSQKVDALEKERSEYKGNAEKLYDPMLEKDSDGNLTGYFVDPKKSPKQYEEFEKNYAGTALFDFYIYFSESYKRLNDYLPPSFGMGNKLPTILKSNLERLTTSENKLDQAKLWVENQFVKSNTDLSTGELTDDAGRVIHNVPIHFTQAFDSAVYNRIYNKLVKEDVSNEEAGRQAAAIASAELPKSLSYDLAASLQMFQYMAENYKDMSEIVDYVEGAKLMVHERSVQKGTPFGKPLTDRLRGLNDDIITFEGSESNAYKMIDALIETQVYGIREVDLGTIAIGNAQLDARKLAKALSKYNSMRMVGGNVVAGMSNIVLGETMQLADAFGGEYYSPKDYLFAKTEYTRELGIMAGDVGRRTPYSKINLLNELLDVLGDYNPKGVGVGESSGLKRVLGSSSMFFINALGEHRMQSKVMISMMRAIKTYNSSGTETGNLYDKYKVENGKLTLDDNVYIDIEGKKVKFDDYQRRNLSRKMQTVLRRLHGNYNSQTAAEWQRNAVYGLIGQFRKWINDTWARRWDEPSYNAMANQDLEGTYYSFKRFLANLLNELPMFNFEIARDWKSMTKHQRANVLRTTYELGSTVFLATSAAILASLAGGLDEDKDKYKLASLRHLMYLNARLSTELWAYVDPREGWSLLRSPAASMSTIQLVGEVLEQLFPYNWGEEYESGNNKGKNKLLHKTEKLVPLWRQVERLSPNGIKDLLQFYNIN